MTCFLSYAEADTKLANPLRRFLQENNIEVFTPPKNIDSKSRLRISLNLEICDLYIYINSKDYKNKGTSNDQRFEWDKIFERIELKTGIEVLGILSDDAQLPPTLANTDCLSIKNVASENNSSWMDDLLYKIRKKSKTKFGPLSEKEIKEIATSITREILEGPIGENLLKAPIRTDLSDPLIKEGVIFLKPEGTYNKDCLNVILQRLLKEEVNIIQIRKYTGSNIKKRQLFDSHYFGPVNVAKTVPKLSDQEKAKLKEYYFENWVEYYEEEVDLQELEELILPALLLLAPPYNLTPDEITEIWDNGRASHLFWNKKPDGLNKIGFQKSIYPVQDDRIDNGKVRLILNGYIPGYKKLLEEPMDEIRVVCFRVSTQRDWNDLRDNVLGGNSNPKKCKAGTLRKMACETPSLFGLKQDHIINGQQNLLHASATDLEGIHEIGLWFDIPLRETSLGIRLGHKLGEDFLPEHFKRFYKVFTGARGKLLETLVNEALESIPPPIGLEDFDEADFIVFQEKALKRFEKLFVEDFDLPVPSNFRTELLGTDAISEIIKIGYFIRRFGYKAVVEKFSQWFKSGFFQEKCRQYSKLISLFESKATS